MPFTIAHTVAVIPLAKYMGKFGALSALIIGSMTPDFSYLIPYLTHQRFESHSLLGIYLFAIPMGLTVYFLYHLLMAPVIVSIFPKALQKHLHPDLFIGRLPDIPTYTLIFSLVLGALTHISWDFFTHFYGAPQYFPSMATPLTSIDGYDIMPYRVLQHSSTLFGMGLLTFWIWAWYSNRKNNHPSASLSERWIAPSYLKKMSFILLLSVPIFVGIINGILDTPETDVLNGMHSKQKFLSNTIVAWAKTFFISTALLGLLYQYRIFKDKKSV
ncbi:MAG: DUF4184 family protein [Cocleimonas sp.]